MATTNKYLTYRGDLRAVTSLGKGLAFTGVHPDGVPTALYRLDVEKLELSEIALSCGGLSLAATSGELWLGGDNARLYHLADKAKALSQLKLELPAAATALVCLSGKRLAALCGEQLIIVDAKQGVELQALALTGKGTAIAADPGGEWLAVGTSQGQVSVYECEGKDAFQISETGKLHEGAVTAILFEPEELRFLSAGADQKLLLTHARGKLEPEDRGRGASHADHVTALLQVPGERFVSVSRDRSCKTWARGGATRPATFDDAVPAVVDAALVEIHQRPHLVIAGQDNTLRFILLDAGGRFSAMSHRLYDAYDRAAHLLQENDVAQRGDAIHALASYDDTRAVELLAQQVEEDDDHGLRLRVAELLAKSSHPRAAKLLEPLLQHRDDKVRLEALAGLRRAAGNEALRPLELAIDSGQANVGTAAVEGLEPLSKKDDQARQLLIRTLGRDPQEVRHAALLSLEKVFAKDSPEPTLIAAKSDKADTRRLALIRGYQRQLLSDSRIEGMVRRSGEDADPDVRRTAFLVALLSRDKLTKAVRERDAELHRQLFELENFAVTPKKGAKAKEPPKLKAAKFSLDLQDYEPLLSAMSSRVTDTCLLGARCLALLGDARAFGTLLQLSREESPAARVQVCLALAAVADPRAAQRLETLLNDPAAEVRDAAYTALERIYEKTPLQAADVGLKSAEIEVRWRALETLSATMRKATGKGKGKSIDAASRALMLRALNDDHHTVSGEAFKTSLGLQIGGSPEATLRFALNSVRENVRREVLTETMAQDKEPWAQQLLIDLLDDPAPKVRDDAYQHMLGKSKGRDITVMQVALQSRHPDIRLKATQSLINLRTKAAQGTLVTAIDDDESEVREKAIQALIHVNAVEILQQAMSSKHTDVRLRAACARALFQDEQAKLPLLETATAEEPLNDADKKQWQKDALVALDGLALLESEEFVPALLPLLDSKHESIRWAAASAIARCARPSQAEALKAAMQHADLFVRFQAAMGLAFCREPVALPVVFSQKGVKVLAEKERLMAAVAYGDAAELHVIAMLDSDEDWIRNAAFIVLMMRDWRMHDGTPARLLAALAAQDARIRLAAAEALERFTDADSLAGFIVRFVNDRGDEQPWEISAEQVEQIADLMAFADPHCQAQAMTVLETLEAEKQRQWDFSWHVHEVRYASQLTAAAKAAKQHKLPKLQADAEEMSQLAFGTYVGLIRQQAGAKSSFGTTLIALRQAAIRRLIAMAVSSEKTDDTVISAARPVLIQALGDNNQAVRMLAFEQLAQVGVEDEARAAAAIECGHKDLAVEALKLLTQEAGKKGQSVLEDIVRTHDDDLAVEALLQLLRMTDLTTAGRVGVASPHTKTRMVAVGWLATAYTEHDEAKQALVAAYDSPHQDLRREAAVSLALNKDERAFEMLNEQLPVAPTPELQKRVRNAMVELGDPRSPDALLDILEADQDKSIDPELIFTGIAAFRLPESAPRLLQLLDKKEWQKQVSRSIVIISGFNQRIDDLEDELPNRKWMDKQHPRHDDVFASYLERCLELNLPHLIKPRVSSARWSLTDAVDGVLKLLSVHPDEALRNAVVEAIGWRFRKRNGPPDALIDLLEHRNTDTKFLAAVGLARGGRNEGINIVLSAVELMTDLRQRILAVQALGELGDERSLDMLLKLASEDGHALQETAAEAIGHLGNSEKADEILALLKRLVKSQGSVARRAIVGLRWLDTPSGWDLVREQARERSEYQAVALEQLGYNDDPATRALLLETLKSYSTYIALPAAKRLFGEETLEPDYAALQSENSYSADVPAERTYHCLQRVCERGEAGRIFEILPNTACKEELAAALMHRDPLPLEAAAAALDSPHPKAIEVAASIVGRMAKKEHGKQLGPAITKWLQIWNDGLENALRAGWGFDRVRNVTPALCRLAWAVGRTQAGKAELLSLLQTNEGVSYFVEVRRAAVLALAECKLAKADLPVLEELIHDADGQLRQTAAEILAQQAAATASKHAGELLSDRAAFRRVSAYDEVDASAVVVENAGHAHYQAIVLPQLVAAGNVDRLSEVAKNADLGDGTRLGAIEALARLANQAADEQLANIGNDKSGGEELRKAAWRGLRRSKRVQAK